ncbi:MAG: peroxiredoxin-like family protein [Hyphomicrobiales bacterium]
MSDIQPLIPGQIVPQISLPLVGGGTWTLEFHKPENFTLLIFYRGWHCPICRNQLQDAQSRMFDFQKRGVNVVAISTDSEERARSTKQHWGLDKLPIAYGLSLEDARKWGLYLSAHRGMTSLNVEEPPRFNEPGIFLVKPDATLYYTCVQSSPFARPSLSDIIKAVDFVLKSDYPARGEILSAL